MSQELHAEELPDEAQAATKQAVFDAAERLFAQHGFQSVSVRDITAAAGVNLASVNYHFGSKDALLFAIFRKRGGELMRERAKLLHEANARHDGAPPVREILKALYAPPLNAAAPGSPRRIGAQFMIRARSEGTAEMREALTNDVSLLTKFADALANACPHLPRETVYWRLHFCLGMSHNNRELELERLGQLSAGAVHPDDTAALLERMLDFAEAGFQA